MQMEARRTFDEGLSEIFLKERIDSQLFVPAGRSFFTSMGKAIAAFEQSAVLDPLLLTFGRLFANLIDGGVFWHQNDKLRNLIRHSNTEILGGEVVYERDHNYLKTTDGRKIPFATLSSGQQEILPLLLILERFVANRLNQITYIEEPEAHLFPEAQCKLIEILAIVLASSKTSRMVITTHSPYVPSKLNNLIKAAEVGSGESRRHKVAEVVKPDRWIPCNNVKAFALCDGGVQEIIDNDGMIDAEYLDGVSSSISSEFEKLLEIEFGNAKKR